MKSLVSGFLLKRLSWRKSPRKKREGREGEKGEVGRGEGEGGGVIIITSYPLILNIDKSVYMLSGEEIKWENDALRLQEH